MSRKSRSRHVAGFTLIEVLVALAVVATSLSAIGGVIATTVRGARGLEDHLAIAGIVETLLAGLVDPNFSLVGSSTGEVSGDRWRMDVSPLPDVLTDASAGSRWIALSVVIRVQTFRGATLQVNTVRLVPRTSG